MIVCISKDAKDAKTPEPKEKKQRTAPKAHFVLQLVSRWLVMAPGAAAFSVGSLVLVDARLCKNWLVLLL